MSVISIIRFFRGTVRFTIRDGFLERFINLCAQNRVPVWNGRREGNRYTACTTLSGSRRLPDIEAIHRADLRARRIGAVHASDRHGGFFANNAFVEHHDSAAIDAHRQVMCFFASDIAAVALDTTICIAVEFDS